MTEGPGDDVLIVVQCRFNSSRLPGKALRELAGMPMIEFLLRRISRCGNRGGVSLVLATTERTDDDSVAQAGKRLGMSVVRGHTNDVLARYLKCLDRHPAKFVIRVTGDNPLTCPDMLNLCIDTLCGSEPDYLAVVDMPLGTAVDGFRARVLRKLNSKTLDPDEREHINLHILRRPDLFSAFTLHPPPPLCRPKLRLTVDTARDFSFVASLVASLEKPEWDIPLGEVIARADRLNGPKKWQPFSGWVEDVFSGSIPDKVAIRVDASRLPGLSFGHAARCLIVARVLAERGAEIIFIMHGYEDGVGYVQEKGFEVVMVRELDRFEETMALVKKRGIRWMVVDLPYGDLDVQGLEQADDSGMGIILVDDARFLFPSVTSVLNSSVRALDQVPEAFKTAGPNFLGPEYFILEAPKPKPAEPVSGKTRVLITFGGSDPTGLTLRVLKTLSKFSWEGVAFTLVLGPGFGDPGDAKCLASSLEGARVVIAPEDLLGLMGVHELVICSGGRTMYEAWAHGLPFLPVASAPHEALEVRAFLKQNYTSFGLEEMDGPLFIDTFRRILAPLTDEAIVYPTQEYVKENMDH